MLKDNKLSSTMRLRANTDFKAIISSRKRFYGSFYLLYHQPNHFNYARLGVVVSKRNIRLATRRNHVKRIAKEAFRQNQYGFIGLDLVIVARKSADKANNQELRQCLDKLFKQAQNFYKRLSTE